MGWVRRCAGAAVLFGSGLAAGGWMASDRLSTAVGQAPEASAPYRHVARKAPLDSDALRSALEREAGPMERQGKIIGMVASLMQPSVVHIEAEKIDPQIRRSGVVEEAGSGVLVKLPGRPNEIYVLTNSHVVHKAELSNIRIKHSDGRRLRAVAFWEDQATDVAVLRVEGQQWQTARIADSNDVGVGDYVLAMGSPFGLSQSITFGIISAKGRRDLELGDNQVKYQDFMQTDAAINPGNSGGPLVNLRGEVIGINTAIASNSGGNEGIGFTIPINMVMRISEHLVTHGSVIRGFLGVTLDPKFTPSLAAEMGYPRGARVTHIRPNTPAAQAAIRMGDVILEFADVAVEDDAHLINLVSLSKIGEAIPLVIWRDKQVLKIQVKLETRVRTEVESAAPPG